MSRARPKGLSWRLFTYNPMATHEGQLTSAQRRRAWHKAHRNHDRMGGQHETIRGRKGRPTRRQRVHPVSRETAPE